MTRALAAGRMPRLGQSSKANGGAEPHLSNVPLNFLLGCSEAALGDYELARHARISDLRKQIFELWDQLTQEVSQANLANWFRQSDRAAINQALAVEESPIAWAERTIAESGRSEDELLPLPSLTPGAAHLAASLRYAERNVAEGKCTVCPKPLAANSVRFCETHLTAARVRYKPKGGKGGAPGTIDYLYSEGFESGHGRQSGSLASLAMGREKRTRKVLAELGIPPESAAVSLKATTEALLSHMPDSEARAMSTTELFKAAMVTSRTTGQNAIRELLAAGRIQRTGKGSMRDIFRYFAKKANREALTAFGVSTKTQVG